MEKIEVWREESVKYDVDGRRVKELAEYFEAACCKYPSEAYLDISTENDYGDYTSNVTIRWKELETDEEFERRKKRQTVQIQTEREMYEKLKKKFEGGK